MDITYDQAVETAAEIGREHGMNAASWVELDGPEGCQKVLRALEDGDPEVYNWLPAPDLSGQWADEYTPDRLATDVGWLPEDGTHNNYDWLSELCNAYETAFSDAVETAIVARCQAIIQ